MRIPDSQVMEACRARDSSSVEMKLLPFAVDHLEAFTPGKFDRAAMRSPDVNKAAVQHWPDRAVSVRHEGRTLAIAGIAQDGRTGWGWAFLSDELRAHKFYVHRLVKRLLPRVSVLLQLSRIEVEVHKDFVTSQRWVERLGFTPVGLSLGFSGMSEISKQNQHRLTTAGDYVRYEIWLP